jgi:serine O-acetyltransferase
MSGCTPISRTSSDDGAPVARHVQAPSATHVRPIRRVVVTVGRHREARTPADADPSRTSLLLATRNSRATGQAASASPGCTVRPTIRRVRGSRATLVADLRHMTAAWDATPAGIVRAALPKVALQPRFRAIAYFRLSQWAWGRPGTKFLAYWFQSRALQCSGAELHPAAQVGPGFSIIHSVGIVVGRDVVAGSDLVLYQGVTIGHRSGSDLGQPVLGNRVRVGAGAKVLGGINIGDDVVIGANAVVLGDVPCGATVTGVWRPAQDDRRGSS